MTPDVEWMKEPEHHDYRAAESYLGLVTTHTRAMAVVSRLKGVREDEFAAKDILRAAGADPLPRDNEHVARDLAKIAAGESLSPVLLVRDPERGRVIIADGWHRVCAAYWNGENTLVRCRIV